MTDKDNLTHRIAHLVAESKKKSGDWPVGDPTQQTPGEKKPGDWPVGEEEPTQQTVGGKNLGDWPISIRQGDWPTGKGDWPLSEVLESNEELGNLAKKVKQNFGVEVEFSRSTRLTDLASAIHHKMVTDKEE